MISKPKTILESDTIPRVDIDFMNDTHFEEIEMVKTLGELITTYQESETKSDSDVNNLSEALTAWLEHTRAHFERENVLMRETSFPAIHIHSEEHTIALNNMESVVKAWQMNKDIDLIADYVFTLWPDWFNGHVNSMDLMTARFAVTNGFDPQATV